MRPAGHRVGDPVRIDRVVVVRKTSAIERQRSAPDVGVARVLSAGGPVADRLEATHLEHVRTCDAVEAALHAAGCRVRVVHGLRRRDVLGADLIITVGGDGTFLRASHCVETAADGRSVPMLGINSAPRSSVGFFCAATADDFPTTLAALASGGRCSRPLWRMRVHINGQRVADAALNDVLVAHRVPAETTRYTLEVGAESQRQKSSGIWVATSAGSTGAIRSAGGDVLPLDDRRVQFRVRELFPLSVGKQLPLVGGVSDRLRLISHTVSGMLYLDGAHRRVPFGMGDELLFGCDPEPLPWVAPLEAESRREAVRIESEIVLRRAGFVGSSGR